MSGARTLRNLSMDMRFKCERVPIDLYAWKELQFHGGRRGEETQIVSKKRKETP